MRITAAMKLAQPGDKVIITGIHVDSPWHDDQDIIGKSMLLEDVCAYDKGDHAYVQGAMLEPFTMDSGTVVPIGRSIAVYGCYFKPVKS